MPGHVGVEVFGTDIFPDKYLAGFTRMDTSRNAQLCQWSVEQTGIRPVKRMRIALPDREPAYHEIFPHFLLTFAKVIPVPVLEKRSAAGGEHFYRVTTASQAPRKLPGELFGATFQFLPIPGYDESNGLFHL